MQLLVQKCERFAILILLNLSIERNEDVQADKNCNKNRKNCERIGAWYECGQNRNFKKGSCVANMRKTTCTLTHSYIHSQKKWKKKSWKATKLGFMWIQGTCDIVQLRLKIVWKCWPNISSRLTVQFPYLKNSVF